MVEESAPILKIRNSKGKELEHLHFFYQTYFFLSNYLFYLSLASKINIAEAYYSTLGKSKPNIKMRFLK